MEGDGASTGQDSGQNLFRPDSVVTPDGAQAAVPMQPDVPAAPVATTIAPEQVQTPVADDVMATSDEGEPEPDDGAITWTASEFIDHNKSSSWYFLLGLAAVGIAAVIFLVTRDPFATITVLIGVLLLGVYASRKPKQQTYTLDHIGLIVGVHHYPYTEFRSFTVIPEGAFSSIEFSPLKRFAMGATIYYDPKDEDRILELLSDHLPMEDTRQSMTDSLMRRIHF